MRSFFARLLIWFSFALCACSQNTANPPRKLLVLSVDGLDWRYLRDRDKLKLRIPNIRELLKMGSYADGVVGVWPTITWPSHTTLITGVRPDQHGILGNRRPKAEGGDYYWTVDLLRSKALWQAAHDAGKTTASITWPVTTGAAIDFNLPEFFLRRQGGSMDLEGVSSKATPNLVAEIASAYPSFSQQWMDDRTRTLAAVHILQAKRPDLLLVHFVDLDSEEHDQGPFKLNANAVLERTDELIGQIRAVLPNDYCFALVSDHGFERVDKTANPRVLLKRSGVAGTLEAMGGIVVAKDEGAAVFLRKAAADPASGIGREIPNAELTQYAPRLIEVRAAFEPAEHVMFGPAEQGEYFSPPFEKGNHGFWPTRRDYRSVYLVAGPGILPGALPEMQLIDIAGKLSDVLGIAFPAR